MIEVFCSELPSQCNIYLAGKQSTTRQCRAPLHPRHLKETCGGKKGQSPSPLLKFSTDHHSLALLRNDDRADKGKGDKNGNFVVEDGYSLSVASLSPPATVSWDNKTPKKSTCTSIDRDICLAHSSLFWEGSLKSSEVDCEKSSLEVFAYRKTQTVKNGANTKEQKSSDNGGLATHGSISMSEVGKDGGDNIVTEQKLFEAGNAAKVKDAEYCLKMEMCQEKKQPLEETIPIDFKPVCVHATEIHTSTDAKSSFSTKGIFVANAEDNKLLLFVATSATLENNGDPCFFPVPLFDTPSALETQCLQDAPLNFSTPIMAIDAVSKSHSDCEEKSMQVNYLAVACYDGTVRIITYQLKIRNEKGKFEGSRLQFCCITCSTFVVDGPVVSLHFGCTGETSLSLPGSHLFLVAGSLCGFACLFHETPSPPLSIHASQNGSIQYFDGPLTIVDGLYDARQEGYEDCVTSVHMCTGNQPAIVVGTQGGRVLLFQQCETEKSAQNESKDRGITMQKEDDEWTSKIDQNKTDISRLRFEQEKMNLRCELLKKVIIEGQQTFKESKTELHEEYTDSHQPNQSPTNDFLEDENNDAPLTWNKNLDETTNLKSAPLELLLIERKMAEYTTKISQLTLVVDGLIRQNTVRMRNAQEKASIYARYIIRKMYRYHILSEYHLPYPIHGIASSEHQDEDGKRDIFVTTGRSFHVLRSFLPDCNSS